MKKKLIVICGPTATGKTAYSIKYAQENNGEIISADSRQVYRHLNIGTAKITQKDMMGIPHHMIDILDLNESFSVLEYQKQVKKILQEIYARGKTPILVGGTGMYIDSIVYDRIFPEVPPDINLRKELEKKSLVELQTILENLDPERFETIDIKNPVRLIRAIEIAQTLGRVPSLQIQESPYEITWIYLDLPDEKLQENIHNRNVSRIENGLIEEVENLHKIHNVSWERLNELGLEYRSVSQFLQGEIESKEKLVEILDQKTWQYVKRQRTWFKKFIPKEQ